MPGLSEPATGEVGTMSDTQDHEDEITTEPPDPLAGADDSVAKVGERLQEAGGCRSSSDERRGPGRPPEPTSGVGENP